MTNNLNRAATIFRYVFLFKNLYLYVIGNEIIILVETAHRVRVKGRSVASLKASQVMSRTSAVREVFLYLEKQKHELRQEKICCRVKVFQFQDERNY